jgi:hypothetical protein
MKPVVDGLRDDYQDRIEFHVYENVNADPEVGAFSSTQGVQYVPTMVLVDADGAELERWVGSLADGTLRSAFDEAAR